VKTPSYFLITLSVLTIGCSYQAQPVGARHVVDIHTLNTHQISDLGQYERFVALETVDEALIGSIDAVKQSSEGDFLIGDFRSTLKIYRFDRDGRFLTAYGNKGQGPGEWENLRGFEIFPSGEILAVSPRMLTLFAPDGALLNQLDLPYFADESLLMGERVYLRTAPLGRKGMKNEIKIYDKELKEVKTMHPFDRRIQILAFLPTTSMATRNGQLFVSQRFDFGLTIYDDSHQAQAYLPFPNYNDAFPDLWKVKPKTDGDIQKMVTRLHRAVAIYAYDEGLFLLETNAERGILRANLLDPQENQMYRFQDLQLFNPDNTFLPLNKIVGAYERGIIGVLDNPDLLEKHRSQYPGLTNIKVTVESNPILVLLDLNMPDKKVEPSS